MKSLTSRLLAFFVLLVPLAAHGGGVSWPFRVDSLHEQGESITVTLRPVTPASEFPESCELLRVTSRYQPEPFWHRSWSRETATPATHAAAIEELRRAAASGHPIRFGSMGTGFVSSASDPCTVSSRGLAVLVEPQGTRAIYSFHDSY